MKLGVKYSLTTIIIIVVLSVFLELISIFVFNKAIHSLNKELFSERVDRLLLLAYEQDELIFEGLYSDEITAQMRVVDKFRIIYRKNKDKVTFPFIVDTSGKVIIHPEEEKDKQLFDKDIVAFMRKQKEGAIEYSYRGIREWCVFKTFKPWNWVFCMTMSTHNKNKAIISFVWAAVATSFVIIILSILVVFFISKKYIHPIHLVIQRLEAIAKGEVDNSQRGNIIETKDEMGMLARAVSKMAEDLQKTTVSRDELVKEITERKQAEEALRVSQQIIEGIINAIPVRVFWKDKALVYLGCNVIFARDAGFADPKDIVGKDDYQMGWRDQAELYRGDDRQVIESGCPKLLIEEPQTTPEGNTITLLTSKIPLRSSKGEIIGVLGTYMDITERKQAEEYIKKQNEFVGTIINSLQYPCYVIGTDYTIILSNKAAKERGVVEGVCCYQLTHRRQEPCSDEHICPLKEVIRTGKPAVTEHIHFDNYGNSRNFEVHGDPILDKDGQVIQMIEYSIDITERKKAEEERASLFEQIKVLNLELEEKVKERTKELENAMQVLEEANIQLQEANAHKNKFLSTMSHELRTPLNGIIGFTDLLKGQFFGPLNEKQMSYVAQVENSSKHLLSLIDGLLTIIKVDMGKIKISVEKFNIEDSVKAVVDMLKSQLNKKNIKVNIECNPQVLEISADKDIFKQISLSLLDNAVKYTPEEGSITIRSSMNSNNIMISVTDTGIGIEPKDQEKLFNEFYQVDRVRDEALGGMGIGLALTKRLVNLQSGEIGVESELGKGSTFWFTLPQM